MQTRLQNHVSQLNQNINYTSSPSFKTPSVNWMIPQKRHKMMANVGSSAIGVAANAAVIRDMSAVGPRVISLEVPRKMYRKQPMKAEYNPY